MKLFLDDYRQPRDCFPYMYKRIGKLNPIYTEEWVVVKNYDEFVKAINQYQGTITHISFDHDLADEHYDDKMNLHPDDYNLIYDTFIEKTGLECAKYFKEVYDKNNLTYPILFVHSMNPIGTQNIINLFK